MDNGTVGWLVNPSRRISGCSALSINSKAVAKAQSLFGRMSVWPSLIVIGRVCSAVNT